MDNRHDKLLILDFFGVICNEIAPFWLRHYLDDDTADAVKADIVGKADAGAISCQRMYELLGERVGIDAALVEREWFSLVHIDREIVNCLIQARALYTVALLSNAPAPFLKTIMGRYALADMFDHTVISSEVGITKPDRRIYEILLKQTGAQAAASIMIDDNPDNIDGAKALGIEGILYAGIDDLRNRLFL